MKKLLILMQALLLSSCASLQYGNFTTNQEGKNRYLATDAVSQIHKIFPPARNTFCIHQKVCDAFGIQLIDGLRKKGYGIRENVCSKKQANFFYVVDETEPHRVYRVSIYIGHKTLSRAYAINGKNAFPVSPWSFKE